MAVAAVVSIPRRLAIPISPGAFRLLLAMIVFVHHISSFGFGPYAVYVFFVLSGFWVQSMWNGRYSKTRNPYLTFLVSRVWRLAPVMVLATMTTVPLLLLIGVPADKVFAATPLHFAFSSVFLLGYSWLPYLPIGSAWSLDVEMQFYALAPLLAVFVKRAGWPLALAAAALTSLAASTFIDHPVLPKNIFFFVVGMAAAAFDWRPSARFAWLSGLSVVAITVLVTLSPWRGLLFGGAHPQPIFAWNAIYNIALAVLTIPFALCTVRQPSDDLDGDMGAMSFIIYLFHWVASQWFVSISGPFSVRLEVALISLVTVPLVSTLVLVFFDRPIDRLRSRWVRQRQQDSRPVGAPVASAT
ncbi:MAG: acyltransferase [Novosphingobium sp.]|nr:acyltransferase [Novosphingobium sp.]